MAILASDHPSEGVKVRRQLLN